MDLKAMLTWTFSIECPIPDDVQNILVEGEKPYLHSERFKTCTRNFWGSFTCFA